MKSKVYSKVINGNNRKIGIKYFFSSLADNYVLII